MKNELLKAMEEIMEIPPGSLSLETDFKALPEWDSLAALSTLIKIEEIFKKTAAPSAFRNSTTINELIAAITKQ